MPTRAVLQDVTTGDTIYPLGSGSLPASVTLKGNAFNGASELVELLGNGKLPVLDGSNLTGITSQPGGNVGGDLSGTLPNPTVIKINGSTPATVATTGSYNDLINLPTGLPPTGTASGDLGGSYPSPTVITGAHLGSHTVPDSALSTNVPLLNTANVFTGGDQTVVGHDLFTRFDGASGNTIFVKNQSDVGVGGVSVDFTNSNVNFQVSTGLGASFAGDTGYLHYNSGSGHALFNTVTDDGSGADVQASSFSGAGTHLTALNATNISSGTLADARLSANVPLLNAANSFTGKNTLAASTTSAAGLNLPQGSAPTSPVNGDVWTTSSGVFARIAGTTVGPFAAGGGGSGTVTSVALTMPSWLTVSGSPITGSGTLAVADNTSVSLPAYNGSALTNINGTNVASGTVAAARVDTAIARLASPTFTGTPAAPTASAGTSTTQVATTAFVNGTNPPIRTVKIQTFAGSGTYTPSTGMVFCTVQGVGGGGGGGSVTQGTSVSGVGGAGGGGQYGESTFTASSIGASQTVTIGALGAGGATNGNAGGTGGTTSLGSLFSVPGGAGGAADTTGNNANRVRTGSAGGTGGTAGLLVAGGMGRTGVNQITAGVSTWTGDGGGSVWGSGAPGVLMLSGTADTSGNAAVGYGGGGSGAFQHGTVLTIGTGGNGSPGSMIITEYCTQ